MSQIGSRQVEAAARALWDESERVFRDSLVKSSEMEPQGWENAHDLDKTEYRERARLVLNAAMTEASPVKFRAEEAPEGSDSSARTPEGWRRIYAYTNDREIIVCGSPPPEEEASDEEYVCMHNCDEMGCGTFSHVLVRLSLPYPYGSQR